MKILHTQVTEHKLHEFSICASDLGLAPGQFPDSIETDIGNGQKFALTGFIPDQDGELIGVRYDQLLGCVTLTILND